MVRWPVIFISTCGPCNCVPTPPKEIFCFSKFFSWALLGLIWFYYCAESDESLLGMMTQVVYSVCGLNVQ